MFRSVSHERSGRSEGAVASRHFRVVAAVLILGLAAAAWARTAVVRGHDPESEDGFGSCPLTRWVGPPGSRPGTYQEWIAAHPLREFHVAGGKMKPSTSGRDLGAAALIVEQSLAAPLANELSQYTANLQAHGYDVLAYTVSGGTPESLRTLLQHAYATHGITGALLVGNLPVPWFQIKSDFGTNGYAEWPCDLFYMDLDGTWLDTMRYDSTDTMVRGHDGIYDSYSGPIRPEIFVGRLMPDGTGDSMELLRNYFRKDNNFWHDSLYQPERALVFVDDDWGDWRADFCDEVGIAFPQRSFWKDPESTRATIYRRCLDSTQEWVSVFAHSSSQRHGFYYDNHTQMDYYEGAEYMTQNPPASFYNFFACSFCRYTDPGYGGAQSIFNPNYGIGAIGSTKTGSMKDFGFFYRPLARGTSLGAAYCEWFNYAMSDQPDIETECWYWGMTLLGDPFLVPANFRRSLPSGWARQCDIPAGPKRKKPGPGGSLAYADGPIFLLKGGNTCEFYQYDVSRDSWSARESLPETGRSGEQRRVGAGGSIAWADSTLLAIKGSNSGEFWEYFPAAVRACPWVQRGDYAGKLSHGSCLVTAGSPESLCAYLAQGGTDGFNRYDWSQARWRCMHSAGNNGQGRPFAEGSSLAWDGAEHDLCPEGWVQ